MFCRALFATSPPFLAIVLLSSKVSGLCSLENSVVETSANSSSRSRSTLASHHLNGSAFGEGIL